MFKSYPDQNIPFLLRVLTQVQSVKFNLQVGRPGDFKRDTGNRETGNGQGTWNGRWSLRPQTPGGTWNGWEAWNGRETWNGRLRLPETWNGREAWNGTGRGTSNGRGRAQAEAKSQGQRFKLHTGSLRVT